MQLRSSPDDLQTVRDDCGQSSQGAVKGTFRLGELTDGNELAQLSLRFELVELDHPIVLGLDFYEALGQKFQLEHGECAPRRWFPKLANSQHAHLVKVNSELLHYNSDYPYTSLVVQENKRLLRQIEVYRKTKSTLVMKRSEKKKIVSPHEYSG